MCCSAVDGHCNTVEQGDDRQDSTSTSAELWQPPSYEQFAVGKLTPGNPGTHDTALKPSTQV